MAGWLKHHSRHGLSEVGRLWAAGALRALEAGAASPVQPVLAAHLAAGRDEAGAVGHIEPSQDGAKLGRCTQRLAAGEQRRAVQHEAAEEGGGGPGKAGLVGRFARMASGDGWRSEVAAVAAGLHIHHRPLLSQQRLALRVHGRIPPGTIKPPVQQLCPGPEEQRRDIGGQAGDLRSRERWRRKAGRPVGATAASKALPTLFLATEVRAKGPQYSTSSSCPSKL